MKKHEMEQRIESALNSLDDATRVGPGPFFFTRVQARLSRNSRTAWEKASGFLAQPAIAFSVICLIITLNTLVIFQTNTTPSFRDQNTAVLSEDSDSDIFVFYDEENNSMEAQ